MREKYCILGETGDFRDRVPKVGVTGRFDMRAAIA
jgi:hypothetical protein